jgi:hypothetical protein
MCEHICVSWVCCLLKPLGLFGVVSVNAPHAHPLAPCTPSTDYVSRNTQLRKQLPTANATGHINLAYAMSIITS